MASERSGHGVLLVEMAGAPGSGKSTVRESLSRSLAARGVPSSTLEDAVRPAMRARGLGRLLVRLLPEGVVLDAALWRLYLARRLGTGLALMASRPEMVRLLVSTQRNRPPLARSRDRRVIFWLIRTMGAHHILRRRAVPGSVLLADEGLVHRTVQLFTSPVERADAERVGAYVASIEPPDLVVWVDTPPDVCARRAESRGARAHWTWSPAEIRAYIDNAHGAVALTCQELAGRGIRVLTVDGAGDNGGVHDELIAAALAEMGVSPGEVGR